MLRTFELPAGIVDATVWKTRSVAFTSRTPCGAPGVPTPYVAAIVDLPEGVSVRCNIAGVEPDPSKLKFGMPVQMVTEKIRTDREGNDVIAFSFKPV